MERVVFHKLFKTGASPAVFPVIHVQNFDQTKRNVIIALRQGAQGVFLINHDFVASELLPIIKQIRAAFPYLWLGVNFLGTTGKNAFPMLGQLAKEGTTVDGYWADNAGINEHADVEHQVTAQHIQEAYRTSGWNGLYFGGTAFKAQRHVDDTEVGKAASLAAKFMDVVTTSGSATGVAAGIKKITDMRKGSGEVAMALASGVTPENASQYIPLVDAILVATGISPPLDFYNIDPAQLGALLQVCRDTANPPPPTPQLPTSWYLSLTSPNVKGEKYAWIDPSSIYIDGRAFAQVTEDLMSHFKSSEYDLVVGIDAMGFPLGAAVATKAGKGFLTVRKAGKLCVPTDEVTYECYSGPGKVMEMRKDAFKPGTRVLIVDQWMETGGTMQAAIDLVERQQGVVIGCVAIAVETAPKTQQLCEKYKVVHVVPPNLQEKIDNHTFLGSEMVA